MEIFAPILRFRLGVALRVAVKLYISRDWNVPEHKYMWADKNDPMKHKLGLLLLSNLGPCWVEGFVATIILTINWLKEILGWVVLHINIRRLHGLKGPHGVWSGRERPSIFLEHFIFPEKTIIFLRRWLLAILIDSLCITSVDVPLNYNYYNYNNQNYRHFSLENTVGLF